MKKVITFSAILFAGALAVVGSQSLFGHRGPTPVVDHVQNGWDGKLFRYEKPAKLVVEESTPTADQVNFWSWGAMPVGERRLGAGTASRWSPPRGRSPICCWPPSH